MSLKRRRGKGGGGAVLSKDVSDVMTMRHSLHMAQEYPRRERVGIRLEELPIDVHRQETNHRCEEIMCVLYGRKESTIRLSALMALKAPCTISATWLDLTYLYKGTTPAGCLHEVGCGLVGHVEGGYVRLGRRGRG